MLDLLVKRMKEEENIDTKAENIIITTGSQQGIALSAMILLEKGDVVVTENPSYLGAINAFRPLVGPFARANFPLSLSTF